MAPAARVRVAGMRVGALPTSLPLHTLPCSSAAAHWARGTHLKPLLAAVLLGAGGTLRAALCCAMGEIPPRRFQGKNVCYVTALLNCCLSQPQPCPAAGSFPRGWRERGQGRRLTLGHK